MGKEVDVVISGGSVEGICDAVGFLKAITKDLGLKIASGAGTSAGAIILGAHAAGHSADEIEELVAHAKFSNWISLPKWYNFIRIGRVLKNGWLSDGENLLNYLGELTFHKRFRDVNFDLHLAGTDMNAAKVRDFNEISDPDMSLALAMRISCSVPGCFKPPEYDGSVWYDGSIRSHYPAELVPFSDRPFYGFLASHVNGGKLRSLSGTFGTFLKLVDNSININVRYSTQMAQRRPITVFHTGEGDHGWKVSRHERTQMIEAARVATIQTIGPTLQ